MDCHWICPYQMPIPDLGICWDPSLMWFLWSVLTRLTLLMPESNIYTWADYPQLCDPSLKILIEESSSQSVIQRRLKNACAFLLEMCALHTPQCTLDSTLDKGTFYLMRQGRELLKSCFSPQLMCSSTLILFLILIFVISDFKTCNLM